MHIRKSPAITSVWQGPCLYVDEKVSCVSVVCYIESSVVVCLIN